MNKGIKGTQKRKTIYGSMRDGKVARGDEKRKLRLRKVGRN